MLPLAVDRYSLSPPTEYIKWGKLYCVFSSALFFTLFKVLTNNLFSLEILYLDNLFVEILIDLIKLVRHNNIDSYSGELYLSVTLRVLFWCH